MTDHRDGRPDQPRPAAQRSGPDGSARPDDRRPDRDERLAAWLAGDVEEAAAAAIEREIEVDPEAAERADAIADVIARLRRVDQVEPPPDLADTLRVRLRETPVRAVPEGRSAGRRSPRHARGRRSWAPVSVAAALALLGVLAVGSILPLGSGGGDSSQEAGDAVLESDAVTAQGQAGGEDAAAELRAQESQEQMPDLSTEGGRAQLLDDVAMQLGETTPSDDGAGDGRAAEGAPPEAAAAPSPDEAQLRGCRSELVPEGSGELVRVVEDVVDDRLVVGAVTRAPDDTLRLVIAAPVEQCEIVVEQTRPPDGAAAR